MSVAALLLPVLALASAGVGWVILKRRAHQQRKEHPAPTPQGKVSESLGQALILELASTLLRAGQSLGGTCDELARVSMEDAEQDVLCEVSLGLSHGLTWQDAWRRAEQAIESQVPFSLRPLRDCLESLADHGAPTADLLQIVAERHRRIEARNAEKRAAKLSVKLVVPLGLCSLPAFICWGIVPVMIALLPGLSDAL